MKKPWYEKTPGLLRATEAEVSGRYTDLRIIVERGTVSICGSLPVMDEGEILGRFQIEVVLPSDFPDSTPVVRETGGRIPWHEDRHVNPQNGEACPIVPEEWLLRPDHGSILAFLDGPVRNFFLGQILVDAGQPWPFGERKHGRDGLLEAYAEMVGTSDINAVVRYLDCLSKETLKGHWSCPCGSNRRVRDCHREELQALRLRIPPRVARQALERLAQLSPGLIRNASR